MERQIPTEEKVFSYIQKHHMLQDHDKIIVGVSGGADSVCLLFVLLEYAKKMPISLAVVHVNHGIRKEAAADAQYVEKLCESRMIPFYLVNADVKKEAEEWKCSEEEAGRTVRYRAFAQAAERFGANKIAVAHNNNDRAETMLFHLFRGSGMKGLGSIRPVRDNIIRPLLCLEREEIEQYLKDREISYCQDATNQEDTYTRNRIRHHILPYVEQEIVEGCVSHMGQTAEMLAETEDYLEQQTLLALRKCVVEKDLPEQYTAEGYFTVKPCKLTVNVADFVKFPPLIQKRMVYFLITCAAGSRKDITSVHVTEVLKLAQREGNRTLHLPYGLVAERSYGHLLFQTEIPDKSSFSTDKLEDEWEMIMQTGTCMELLGCSAEEAIKSGKLQEVAQNEYTKRFDCDKIKKSPVLRTRQTGDYLTIRGKDGELIHKSVKDYMIESKIPRAERDNIPLLAERSHVLWLAGYRISEYYKIDKHTKHILQVQLVKKYEYDKAMEEKNG